MTKRENLPQLPQTQASMEAQATARDNDTAICIHHGVDTQRDAKAVMDKHIKSEDKSKYAVHTFQPGKTRSRSTECTHLTELHTQCTASDEPAIQSTYIT